MTRAASWVWVLAAAATLFFLRFGYEFGAGDQDELLSLLLHQIDPELLSQDWYVVDQANQFTVRTPFLWLMQGLTWAIPLWLATLVVYLVGWFAVAWSLYRLAESLSASALASSAATLVILVFIPTWTLGGNSLTANLLAPEMLGWALALPAVRLAYEKHLVRAGVLLALAAYLHLLVGALVTGALGLAILLGALCGPARERWRHAWTLGGTVLILALPMILAILRYRHAGAPLAEDGVTAFFLFAELRLPHHYMPSIWGLGRWARFGLLAGAGGFGLAILRRQGRPMRFVERHVLAIGLMCLVAGPLIVWGGSLFVAQLQVFKLTVLANALLAIAACAGITRVLPQRVRAWPGLSPGLSAGLAAGVLLLLTAGIATRQLDAQIGPWARAEDPFSRSERWIAENTPNDALVAAPPNRTTVRLATRRSVVVSFKAAPFNDIAMREWYRRLLELAPRVDTTARGLSFGDALDAAYARNTAADWDRLAQRYGITHVIRDRAHGEAPRGEVVFEAGTWAVYEIAPSATHREGDGDQPSPPLQDRPEG
ncbi:MAG: DUF6798 domain-containing protein [Bacteroidota bacterium]